MKKFFKALYRAWMKFAHFIGRINTTLLLTFFYFLIMGLAKLVALVLRKDLLDSSWKDRPSYWKKRGEFKMDEEAFLRPY